MKTLINNIKRPIEKVPTFEVGKSFEIVLQPIKPKQKATVETMLLNNTYTIEVKGYMLKVGTPSFDFMTKFNNDKPMPKSTYTGIPTKETRGMFYFESETWTGWVIKSAITSVEEI